MTLRTPLNGMQRGPCAKRRVVCWIYPKWQMPVAGENDCANPQPTCPRLPGEDYTKCKTVCQQDGHAEEIAIQKAKHYRLNLVGAKARIEGHYWMCQACGKALREAGIVEVSMELAA